MHENYELITDIRANIKAVIMTAFLCFKRGVIMTRDEYYSNLIDASHKLKHHGVKGQSWGKRQYQNPDGTLTPLGREHYGYSKDPNKKMEVEGTDSSVTKKVKQDYNNMSDKEFMAKYKTSRHTYAKRVDKYGDPYMNSPLAKTGKKLSAKNVLKKDLKKAKAAYKYAKSGSEHMSRSDAKAIYKQSVAQAKDKYSRKMNAIDGVVKNSYNMKLMNDDARAELADIARNDRKRYYK